jgi:hypothetical protein
LAKNVVLQPYFLYSIGIMPPKCNHIGQIKEKELSREEIAGVCQVFAASSFGFQFFYEITENKKSASKHLTPPIP